MPYCVGDTLTLRAEGQPGFQYRWRRNDLDLTSRQTTLRVTESGRYTVLARPDSAACDSRDSLQITFNQRPTVQWDSIPPVCQINGTSVALGAAPAGGIYAGTGIVGNRFDPTVAGPGRHRLTYTFTTPGGCVAKQTRWAVVAPGLTLTGPTDYQINQGDSVRLLTSASQPVSQYRWEPPTALSQADVASPVATPGQTTAYQLTAVSASGCASTLGVRVEVKGRLLYIPSAFSPNADGVNDSWVIFNSSLFPRCEVQVYDRWGELVFYSQGYSQPWDGTYRQVPVRAGLYTYLIRTEPGLRGTIYTGQLTVTNR
jgi:gliding motility-associated-like protein